MIKLLRGWSLLIRRTVDSANIATSIFRSRHTSFIKDFILTRSVLRSLTYLGYVIISLFNIQEKQQWLHYDAGAEGRVQIDCDVQQDLEVESPPGPPSFVGVTTSDQLMNSPPAFTLPMLSDSSSEETGGY